MTGRLAGKKRREDLGQSVFGDSGARIGDVEQNPSDLLTLADYPHLTALLAPRPALLIYNEKDLYHVLKNYVCYYNENRTHSSIDFDAPKNKFSYSDKLFNLKNLRKRKILSGLITDFSLVA